MELWLDRSIPFKQVALAAETDVKGEFPVYSMTQHIPNNINETVQQGRKHEQRGGEPFLNYW